MLVNKISRSIELCSGVKSIEELLACLQDNIPSLVNHLNHIFRGGGAFLF